MLRGHSDEKSQGKLANTVMDGQTERCLWVRHSCDTMIKVYYINQTITNCSEGTKQLS